MLKPYTVFEETTEEITYELKTIYLWILYGILLVCVIGIAFKNTVVTTIGSISMVLFFFTVSLHYLKLGSITKQAAITGSVKISGSKWSFSNPLRITISRAIAGQHSSGQPATQPRQAKE